MARKLVNGTKVSIGATFGTETDILTLSNANPAIAGFDTGHGITVGSYVQIMSSGWGIEGRVFRASVVSTNNITLEGFDTTDTGKYPAGEGVGAGRSIATWALIQQANKDQVVIEGGEQGFEEGQYIDDIDSFEFPTRKAPARARMVVDEDRSQAYWTTVLAAEEALTNYPIRFVYPGSSGVAVSSGIWGVSAAPDLTGFVRRRTLTVALAKRFTEYTS